MESESMKFSVILAAYNVEKYIEEAIESVLSQNFEQYELIIVDDCSTDMTKKKINKYKNNSKIQILTTQKNTGTAGGARNLGMQYAKGEYMLFLDGDDKFYDENVLTKVSNVIGNQNYDIIFLGYQDLGNENKIRTYNEQTATKKSRIICDVSFSVSCKCWNRGFIEKNNIKFIEGMYYEDEIFCMKTNILEEKTTFAEFPIFYYRRNRNGSVMSTPSIRKCSDWYRMLAELMDLFEITPDEYKPYLLSFIKNESENIPLKIKAILKSMIEKTGVPIFPKRDYKYSDFVENLLNEKTKSCKKI